MKKKSAKPKAAAVLRRLDLKAQQLGMTRQSLVKYWIAERLELVKAA